MNVVKVKISRVIWILKCVFFIIDECFYGASDSYIVNFYNTMAYGVDVIGINFEQEEVVYYENLAPGAEFDQVTYWISIFIIVFVPL